MRQGVHNQLIQLASNDLGFRVGEGGLEAMKSVDELVLLLLVEGRQPRFLMPVHEQPKLMGDLARLLFTLIDVDCLGFSRYT